MKKRVLSSILAGVLAVSVFAGCGSKTEDNSQAAADNSTTPATEAAAEESTEAAGGTVESKGTITVAASATPHAEILAAAKPILAEQGWDLEVTEFDDYVLPNEVVESGEMDANYFQHVPYLDSFNEEKGTHLVEVGKIHYEPFGIYPGTKSSLDDIADGDVIAVPNDTTNEARALLLLQDNGIITLKDGAGLEATVNDIAENPYNVEIQELAPRSTPPPGFEADAKLCTAVFVPRYPDAASKVLFFDTVIRAFSLYRFLSGSAIAAPSKINF